MTTMVTGLPVTPAATPAAAPAAAGMTATNAPSDDAFAGLLGDVLAEGAAADATAPGNKPTASGRGTPHHEAPDDQGTAPELPEQAADAAVVATALLGPTTSVAATPVTASSAAAASPAVSSTESAEPGVAAVATDAGRHAGAAAATQPTPAETNAPAAAMPANTGQEAGRPAAAQPAAAPTMSATDAAKPAVTTRAPEHASAQAFAHANEHAALFRAPAAADNATSEPANAPAATIEPGNGERAVDAPTPRALHHIAPSADAIPTPSVDVPLEATAAALVTGPTAAPSPQPIVPTEAPAAAAQAVEQPELSAAVGRLRTRTDGTHELRVALHPEDLGTVTITAHIRGGELTVTVGCADEAAKQAVTAALPQLHHELQGALRSVDVSLDGGAAQGNRQPFEQARQFGGRDSQPHRDSEPHAARHQQTEPRAQRAGRNLTNLDRWL